MNTLGTQWHMVAGVIAAGLIALAIWFSYQKRRSTKRLHDRHGGQYDRTVEGLGSRTKAETELKTREWRMDKPDIISLTAADAARFSRSWNNLQGRFVNNPQNVVTQADQLVREVLLKRGYLMGGFEHRAADISVDHPAVAHIYQAARSLMALGESGKASIEELRQAVALYRALFDDLLEIQDTAVPTVSPTPVAMNT